MKKVIKNIISFGCSHSLGWYTDNDDNNIQSAWPRAIYERHNNINYFFHVAMPAHGVIDYCYILTELDKDGILRNTDRLIIQHTSEPRCIFYKFNPKIIQEFYKNEIRAYFDSDIIKPYKSVNTMETFVSEYGNSNLPQPVPLNMTGTSIMKYILDTTNSKNSENFHQLLTSFMPSNTVTQSIKLSYEKIHEIAKRNNIELCEFIWPGMTTDIEHPLHSVSEGIVNYSDVSNFNGHVGMEAHAIITNNIINYLNC